MSRDTTGAPVTTVLGCPLTETKTDTMPDVPMQRTEVPQLRGFPPKLFVIGAQKSGTTALCEHLDRLPDIELATPKEPGYFTRNYQRGSDWYRRCFTASDRILLDGTPGYAAARPDHEDSPHNAAASRLHALAPEARLIYIVRDPVRRAWSAYWHAVRVGEENRPPSEALTTASVYVRSSRYAYQLDRYLALFPRSQILCVDYGYFRTEPDAVISGIARWLRVSPRPEAPLERRNYNESFRYNKTGALIRDAVPRPMLAAATATLKAVLPAAAVGRLKAVLTKGIPELDDITRNHLYAHVADDYRRFCTDHADLFLDGRPPPPLR